MNQSPQGGQLECEYVDEDDEMDEDGDGDGGEDEDEEEDNGNLAVERDGHAVKYVVVG